MKHVLTLIAAAAAFACGAAHAIDVAKARTAADGFYSAMDQGDGARLLAMQTTKIPGMPRDPQSYKKMVDAHREANGKRLSRKFVKVVPGKTPQVSIVLSESRFERTGLAVERLQLVEEAPGVVKVVANSVMPCRASCDWIYKLPNAGAGGADADEDEDDAK